MWQILVVHILLLALDIGSARPYCRWQKDGIPQSEGICLETADGLQPGKGGEGCTDGVYTDLIANVRHCFDRQDPNFTGCTGADPVGGFRCEKFWFGFPVKQRPQARQLDGAIHCGGDEKELTLAHLCLPPANRSCEIENYDAEHLTWLLGGMNVCEQRGVNSTKALDGQELTISAPCHCAFGPVAESPLCEGFTILPDARQQCCACRNIWDVWLHDYLGKSKCRDTAVAAAPMLALCRGATSEEECTNLNFECGNGCGDNASALNAAPVSVPSETDSICYNTSAAPPAAAQEQSGAEQAPVATPTASAACTHGSTVRWGAVAAAAAGMLMHSHGAF